MDTLQSLTDLYERLTTEDRRLSEEIASRTRAWEQELKGLEARRVKVAAGLSGLIAALEVLPDLPGSPAEEEPSSTLKDSLLSLINSRENPVFTAPDLYQELVATSPALARHKASVSSAVKQIHDEGQILLLSEARGRRAAVYARGDYKPIVGGSNPGVVVPINRFDDDDEDEQLAAVWEEEGM